MRFLLLLTFLCLMACDSSIEHVEVTDQQGYTEKYTRSTKDYAKQGRYEKSYPSGKVYEQAWYENDTLQGEKITFFENGDTQSIFLFDKGKYEGAFKEFYENGKLMQEGIYENDQMNGSIKTYYKTGALKEIATMSANEENGPFTEYHENGKIKVEGAFKDGDNEHGELKFYDENGVLEKTMDCDMGRCRTTWTKENGESE